MKNEAEEYKTLADFSLFIEGLLAEDKYLSRKTYSAQQESIAPAYKKLSLMENEGVLAD